MIWEELKDFENRLKNAIGVNTHIGFKDFSPDEYPIIQILPEIEMPVFSLNTHNVSIDIPLTLKVIAQKDREVKVFQVFDKLLKKFNQINDEKNNPQDVIAIPEYTNNTYEISLPYILKLILQDTDDS